MTRTRAPGLTEDHGDWYGDVPVHTTVVTTETLSAIGLVRSMEGPITHVQLRLGDDTQKTELLWLVGYDSLLVEPDGRTIMSQEYNCHSNFSVDNSEQYWDFTRSHFPYGRLFTLSQGQQSIRLPKGFGIPILSTEPLNFNAQILNLNARSPDERVDVREIIKIRFIRQKDLQEDMIPLMFAAASGYKRVSGEGDYYGVESPDEKVHGPGCGVGTNASDTSPLLHDALGRRFTSHWVVPPGREVTTSLVTRSLRLLYDTTVHYIAIHLHPFAESLELRDRTTNETVYKGRTRLSKGRIGIAHVDYYSSSEGIPLKKDHEYELVTVYNNTSRVEQDSMANMFIYLRNKRFSAGEFAK